MGWLYEIKLPKAITCRYFFAVIKIVTYKGYS